MNKITQEQFDKLPQLDRIEFRQKKQILEDRFDFSFTSLFKYPLFISFLVLAIALFSPKPDPLIVHRLGNIFFTILQFSILGILFDFLLLYLYYRNENKLEQEYFKIEVKKDGTRKSN